MAVSWSLRLQGVGNAFATELGSAMATLERDGAPWLTIDCGSDGLTHYLAHYGQPPRALFITHAHLDHIGGFERLFGASYWSDALRGEVKLFVPAALVPLLQQRIGSYPNAIAEGGANFWDAFRVIPVGDHFWLDGVRVEVFATRHHWPDTSFGLRLRGAVAWTGDTRPIPEQLAKSADAGELVLHDCALHGNPSHSGIDDLEREYPPELLARCRLYHYASTEDGAALEARGHRIVRADDVIPLAEPTAAMAPLQ